ncbi:YTH domain-containing protein ECT3 [Linum perenne]
MLNNQSPLGTDGIMVDSTQGAVSVGSLRDETSLNACSSQAQAAYHRGYDGMISRWGVHLSDGNMESLENGVHGVHDDFSLQSHGYGYGSQMPQGQYVPFQSSYDGPFYNVQEFPNSNQPYFQQHMSHNSQHVASRNPISEAQLPAHSDPQVASYRYNPRPGQPHNFTFSSEQNNFPGMMGQSTPLQQGFDGIESGRLWSDWSKPVNGTNSFVHLSSSPSSANPASAVGFPENHFTTGSRRRDSFYDFGSHSSSSYKSYPQVQNELDSGYEVSLPRMNCQNWPTLDEARVGGRCNDFSCSCTIALDTLSERNKGPRAFKPRSQALGKETMVDVQRTTIGDAGTMSHNKLDSITEFKDAKFFVIKSYSEDNVHKSIKYGVWASTQNGNKKLDAAYSEAQEKQMASPVFLLFSVNASAQFCGVAEMVGPVDFEKSVDYWQQDKWTGQFPVKWHIIKDVPNSQFRHIILENNDNKPVTNSRDTQEVQLDHGIEMLHIFNKYVSHSSILEDFEFYEERQKAMQVRKSRQQANTAASSTAAASTNEHSHVSEIVKNLSKSFAEAVSVNEDNEATKLSALPNNESGSKPEKQT